MAVLAFGVVVAGQNPADVPGTATTPGNIWPPALKAPAGSPALSPADALKTFSLPPGFHVELVASEPMIESPILIDFDADGRMYVLEQLSFLPDMSGRDSREAINRVSVLEDTDNDGLMDKKTVFADKLLMPRALKVLDRGVLIGEPPNLWLMTDTNGDLVADTKELVVDTYGRADGGIEHNANSLYWAIDNTMYSSEHTWDLKLTGGKFESIPTLSRGQWQISQDDAGRIYRNVNSAPLFVDYTPAAYFMRNPNLVRTRGLYEPLIDQEDALVYPVRQTRGVNRGYRDPFFRPDGSAIVIQGAGTPTVYRGEKYPRDLYGNAFITDSPTNLVHRIIVDDDGQGRLTGRNGYERGEFLASSDERFRPVNLFDGPDGNLYVVDMYRGVVQAEGIWSEYLTGYIKQNNLQLPVGRGRIWRVVHGTTNTRGPKPSLSTATPAALVETLSHANGWWRDNAQRLLVERNDKSVLPALTARAASAPDWKTRLHALWTVDGMGDMSPAIVTKALADTRPEVRAAGVRIAERWLRDGDQTLTAAVVKLSADPIWNVRRQVAASIGEMPAPARVAPAAAMLSTRDGADGIFVDTLLSGLRGLEADVLDRVLQGRAAASQEPREAVAMLAAAVSKSGDVAAFQRVLVHVTDASRPEWQRLALLNGLDTALPAVAGRGGGGRGLAGLSIGRVIPTTPGRGMSLPAEPVALTSLAAGRGAVATSARVVADKINWPGRPAPTVTVAPLSPEQQKRQAAGAEIYKNICLGCHQEDGAGKDKIGASLLASAYVANADPAASIRILLSGKEGPIGLMPPIGPAMTDEQIASVLTYVRRAWGNTAPAVDPLNVMEVRGLTRARNKPWTDQELQPPARGGGGGRGGRGGGGAGAAGAPGPARGGDQ